MEKLLNLLQEFYWENRKFSNDDWFLTMTNWVENLSGAYAQTYIISLQGGFIQRLVEQDKIDLVKFSDKLSSPSWTMEDRYKYLNSDFWLYNSLLMLLSISEQPIELLISVLK
jgi:hypothetical protein